MSGPIRHLWLTPPPMTLRHTSPSQLFSNNASDHRFEWLVSLLVSDIAAQHLVDERLIVTAPCGVNLSPEPIKDVIVHSDSYSRLVRCTAQDRSPPGFVKIIFSAHCWLVVLSAIVVRNRVNSRADQGGEMHLDHV